MRTAEGRPDRVPVRKRVAQLRNRLVAGLPVLQRVFRSLVARGLVGRSVWSKVQPLGVHRMRCPGGGDFLYDAAPDDVLARSIVWTEFSDWESTTVPTFCELARSSTGLLDVGAFTGVYALLACAVNPDIVVAAVEPNPGVWAKLRRNLEVNGFADRTTVVGCALSDVAGSAVLTVPDDTTAATLNSPGAGDRVVVELRTGDEVLEGRTIDLVKIDAEGHEMEVLRGLRRTLEAATPAVFVECLGGRSFDEVRLFLEQLGYSRFTYLGPTGPRDVDDGPEIVPGFPNYLCRAT